MSTLIIGWVPKPGTRRRGSGKTGGMAWHLKQWNECGKEVLTNFTTKFSSEITANDLKRMPESMLRGKVVGTTEVHQFLESRRTQKGDQIRITYTILQLRKLRSEYHWDSQAPHQVDKRLIEQTDILIHCENLGCYDMECVDRACGIVTCGIFHYEVYDAHLGTKIDEYWLNGPETFYTLFDSEEIVMDLTTDDDTEND